MGNNRNQDDDDQEKKKENWKAFDSDTKAGRLLHRLYGGHSKPVIHYPVPKRKVNLEKSKLPFLPGPVTVKNHSLMVMDPHNSKREINVPHFSSNRRQKKLEPLIDSKAVKRKAFKEIQVELEAVRLHSTDYRPINTRIVDHERKAKLQEMHTIALGSVLPSDLLPGQELSKKDLGYVKTKKKSTPSKKEDLLLLQKAVLEEIEERNVFMDEMKKLGQDHLHSNRIQREIKDRFYDLDKIKKMLNKLEITSSSMSSKE